MVAIVLLIGQAMSASGIDRYWDYFGSSDGTVHQLELRASEAVVTLPAGEAPTHRSVGTALVALHIECRVGDGGLTSSIVVPPHPDDPRPARLASPLALWWLLSGDWPRDVAIPVTVVFGSRSFETTFRRSGLVRSRRSADYRAVVEAAALTAGLLDLDPARRFALEVDGSITIRARFDVSPRFRDRLRVASAACGA